MIALGLAEIARIVGGTLHGADATITGPAFLDTRTPEPGGLFVAFAGEHTDGHDHAVAAVGAGAAGVLGERATGVPTVVVPDARTALARLAHEALHRRRVLAAPLTVVAITGSQGKTSAKDLLARVLADDAETVATYGSFNNELGLPLTVLRVRAETRYLVLEMGARGVGHLAELCAIARPDISVVLNVGHAHVGEFGSQEAIARGKGEIVEALTPDGIAVLNADDPLVRAMAERTTARVDTFGLNGPVTVLLEGVGLDDLGRPSFDLVHAASRAHVDLAIVGEHHAGNAAAAATVALACGLDLARVATSLAAVTALSRWRMELTERADGLLVLNDAYNANPESMAMALRTIAGIGRTRGLHTVAVLGEMRELGSSADAEHREIGRLAVELGIDDVVVVGPEALAIVDGIVAAGGLRGSGGSRGSWGSPLPVPDVHEAALRLREDVRAPAAVLVKASRAVALERVAESLLAAYGPDDEKEAAR